MAPRGSSPWRTLRTMVHTGQGKLIFGDNEAVTVNYWLEEFVSDEPGQKPRVKGRVSHAKGHPDWHPILTTHPRGPYTLVIGDGRKLEVFFENLQGSIVGDVSPS